MNVMTTFSRLAPSLLDLLSNEKLSTLKLEVKTCQYIVENEAERS